MCVCLLPVRAKAKIRGNKYGATRSAGDYRKKVQLARLCACRFSHFCFDVALDLSAQAKGPFVTLEQNGLLLSLWVPYTSIFRACRPAVCLCLLLVRAKAKIKGNKYGATRSAGDYRRKVQLARLCAVGGKDMV